MRLRVGLLAVALTAAGCTASSGNSPSTTPRSTLRSISTSASTTTAPSSSRSSSAPTAAVPTTGSNTRPGERPPVLPAVARTETAAGARSFAAYWFKALDWGYATTSSTLPRMYFLPVCTDCTRFMSDFDDARRANQHFRGGRITVLGVMAATNDRRNGAEYADDVSVATEQLYVLDSAGKVLSVSPAIRSGKFRLWIRWTGTKFIVVDFKEVVTK